MYLPSFCIMNWSVGSRTNILSQFLNTVLEKVKVMQPYISLDRVAIEDTCID